MLFSPDRNISVLLATNYDHYVISCVSVYSLDSSYLLLDYYYFTYHLLVVNQRSSVTILSVLPVLFIYIWYD